MTDKTPEAEAPEHPPEEQETQPEVLETLRSDVEEMKTNLKEEVVNAFRDELQKLSQPQREKVPAPEIEPEGYVPFPPGVDPAQFAIDEVRNLARIVRAAVKRPEPVVWIPVPTCSPRTRIS